MRANYKLQRLYIDAPLYQDAQLVLEAAQSHYLNSVLRLKVDATILVFNGQHGEWLAQITHSAKKQVTLQLLSQQRLQGQAPDLIYYFAPLKHARLDYMVQKAVEMGVSCLQPVQTQHTQVSRLNLQRMQANIIEAAEQCGILNIPQCRPIVPLQKIIEEWESPRRLIFCDEAAADSNPLTQLALVDKGPLAVLIGPEGGFSQTERDMLLANDFVTAIALGPRILRADTAAVAALAIIGATLTDW